MNRIVYLAKLLTAVAVVTIEHYWLTLAAAGLAQTIATMAAYIERGGYGVGSELLVYPLVLYAGYRLTPRLSFFITKRGDLAYYDGR